MIGEGARPAVDREDEALDGPGDRDGHAHHGGEALLDRQRQYSRVKRRSLT